MFRIIAGALILLLAAMSLLGQLAMLFASSSSMKFVQLYFITGCMTIFIGLIGAMLAKTPFYIFRARSKKFRSSPYAFHNKKKLEALLDEYLSLAGRQ